MAKKEKNSSKEIDEQLKYEAAYKKALPHAKYTDYRLTEEDLEFIDTLIDNKLLAEQIEPFKSLIKKIWGTNLAISAGCGACKSITKAAIIKLKTLKSIQK